MPQPSVSWMEPPFGDDFQNFSFADQALTSTELLATSTDPDFMYELDRDMSHRQSPYGDGMVGVTDGGKEMEGSMDQLMSLGECETICSSSAFEQWDSYWEDLTRYTRLASCDIWGTKEVDFLGLDDFSSPYQDEEVISQTPTLAQLNSEDSQPVCEALYPHAEQTLQLPGLGKRPLVRSQVTSPGVARPSFTATVSSSYTAQSLLPDFPEGSQRATRPVPSCTETMAKTQSHSGVPPEQTHIKSKTHGPGTEVAALPSSGSNFVRKAKVHISSVNKVQPEILSQTDWERLGSPMTSQVREKASTSAAVVELSAPEACVVSSFAGRPEVSVKREAPASWDTSAPVLVESNRSPEDGGSGRLASEESLAGASGGIVLVVDGTKKSKEEEHNYSLFLTRSRLAGRTHSQLEEDEEEEDEEEEEEEEDDEEEEEEEEEEGAGLDLDDEDHDEGLGSEHELSENEEEEEEDDDYEADKDDDMSDAFSEPGCDMELTDDINGLTAGVSSRKRGKRRYFWEYSEQLTPSKQERMLKPSEWDWHTLPSNLYQKNGPLHGKYMLKKSRRTDVEDLTPNPRKLLQIGTELRKLNKVISDLTPVSELPLTARPWSRKEKNKLASRACRLKKKAQYEANKVKLWGLSTEYDRLLFVINAIKEEIVVRVEDATPRSTNMADTLDRLIQETLVSAPVAGQTSDFVNKILENTGRGDPTGGLVGLRVPTSKV